MRPIARLLSLVLAFGVLALAAPGAYAEDPAIPQIDTFDHALIEAMKQGPQLGVKGRYRLLAPVVEQVFDLPVMTRFAVGEPWTKLSNAQQKGLIEAFTRLTVASYAHNFASYDGERFTVDPNVETRGPDKVVETQLALNGKAPVNLNYRMRQATDGAWKVIDIYYGAISQLATRRSDFQAPLASGGAQGLIAHLDTLSDGLLK